MRRWAGLVLRLGLAAVCLVYAFWGVKLDGLLEAAGRFSLPALAAMIAVVWLDFLVMGFRMRYATGSRIGLLTGFNAGILGIGANNILPAKAGEAVKVLYLSRNGGMTMGETLGMVFWERFSDLHMLLVVGAAAAVFQNRLSVVLPLAAVIAAMWAVVLAIRVRPSLGHVLVRLVYFQSLRRLAADMVDQLSRPRAGIFFIVLMAFGLGTWALYALQFFCLLPWGAGLDLSPAQTLAVFAMGAAGLAAPSSPGGVGVFEAVMVAALAMYGVGREQALAAGLVFHMTLYLQTTIYALFVLAFSGLRMRALRRAWDGEQPPEASK